MSARKLTDRQVEEIQERSRRAWNKLVARDEADYQADTADEEPRARPNLHVVDNLGGQRGE